MTTPLVDPEGFPRADIDVYAVRHARVSLNRLRNDHRDVVDRLGRVLEQVYAIGAVIEPTQGAGKMVNGDGPAHETVVERPLARVNVVSDNSPSATAVSPLLTPRICDSKLILVMYGSQGIQAGDLIIQFGTLSSAQSHGLPDIGQLVQRSEGVRPGISHDPTVLRADSRLFL